MRRAIASLLALSLAGTPCLGVELRDLPAIRPEAPVARLTLTPTLAVLPELGAPELKIPDTPKAPEVPAAETELTVLSSAKSPESVAPVVFDAAAPGARLAGGDAAPVSPPTVQSPPATTPPRLAKPGRKVPRGLIALGIAASTLAPVLYNAEPPLMLVYTVAAAAAIVGVYKAVSAAARAVARRVAPRREPARAPPKTKFWRAVVLRVMLGLAAGAIPSVWTAPIVETGARIASPAREIRALSLEFGREVAATLSKNREGAKLLDRLRDRGGKVRLPDFYVGDLDNASGFSFPVLNAVFIDPSRIAAHGWTVQEFVADPAKQRQFARENDELVFHEVFHAGQFRRPGQPGQFERFPRQLLSFLTYELEYEDYISTQLYAHERLKDDPHAEMEDLSDYESFLDDMDVFIHRIDGTQTYHLFSHVRSERYEAFFAEQRARHQALSAEGYHLLALRHADDPAAAKQYEQKAAERAGQTTH